MLQLILMSLGAYVFQVSASPALPFPPVAPPVNPPVGALPIASLPTAGVIPTPVVLTSIPGASVLNAPTGVPSLPGPSIPGAGLPTSPSLPTGAIPTADLPTAGFPPLPTLTNSVLLSSISAVLSAVPTIPTGFPTPDLPLPPLPTIGEPPSLPTSNLPVPSVPAPGGGVGTSPKPSSIVTYLSSAIKILVLLVQLIQETINTGGVRVPGVTDLGVDVGANLLAVLLKVAADLLDKAGAVGAIAF